MPQQEEIKILARPQVNPLKCDFEADRRLLEGAAYFGDAISAEASPLAKGLFAVEGVESVLMRENVVTVTSNAGVSWPAAARAIGAAIRAHIQSGEPAIRAGAAEASGSDESIREKVQSILDSEINPAVAMHGGVIELLDVQHGVVYVRMGGGCHGCASSTATLKQGVEQAIRAKVPEVIDILDTTDHASGTNPYYSPY